MKKHLLLLLIAISAWHYAYAQTSAQTSAQKRALETLKTYSPVSHQLLSGYYSLPRSFQNSNFNVNLGEAAKADTYLDQSSSREFMNSLGTLVHEICHGYTFEAPFSLLNQEEQEQFHQAYSAIFIDSSTIILLEHTPTFETKKMAPMIEPAMRTFRFETYVYPSSPDLGAQKAGVYGLLDEWNAYYHDTRTSVDLFDYYNKKSQKNPMIWLDFFEDVNGTYFAHLEFKYFILSYLLYAKKNHPKVYKQIITNPSFLNAYKTVNSRFTQIVKKYRDYKTRILTQLTRAGFKTYETDEFVYVESIGQGNYQNVYTKLENELAKIHYQKMDRLLISK